MIGSKGHLAKAMREQAVDHAKAEVSKIESAEDPVEKARALLEAAYLRGALAAISYLTEEAIHS